jgi:hypothetical protein
MLNFFARSAGTTREKAQSEEEGFLEIARWNQSTAATFKQRAPLGVEFSMQSADYYRDQAARARQLRDLAHQDDLRKTLDRLAEDFDDIAEDLETGAIEIRHPELLPQNKRSR